MSWQAAVEKTVTGFGYELVECERGSQGLLRVFIDRVPGQVYDSGPGEFVTVEDCEKVTRQLQYVLEVENCDYSRLEVSSPGLDRPLKKPADYARFTGERIDITLKLPFQGRKKYQGVLAAGGMRAKVVVGDGFSGAFITHLSFQPRKTAAARLRPACAPHRTWSRRRSRRA